MYVTPKIVNGVHTSSLITYLSIFSYSNFCPVSRSFSFSRTMSKQLDTVRLPEHHSPQGFDLACVCGAGPLMFVDDSHIILIRLIQICIYIYIAKSMSVCVCVQGSAHLDSSLLLMAVMCVLLPATLHATRTELHINESELTLSRITSCIMLLAYAAYIYFQLSSPPKLREEVREYIFFHVNRIKLSTILISKVLRWFNLWETGYRCIQAYLSFIPRFILF